MVPWRTYDTENSSLQTKMRMKQLDADSPSLIVNIGMAKMLSCVKADATAEEEATIISRLPIKQ